MADPILQGERIAAEADRIGARFATQLTRVLRELEDKLRDLLATDVSGSATAQAARINRMRIELRAVLRESGYDALVDAATQDPLDLLADRVLAGRLEFVGLSEESRIRLSALKNLHLENLLTEADVTVRELSQAVGRGVLGAASRGELITNLREVVNLSEARIQTIYDTSVSIYGRQVEAEQAGDDPQTAFAYVGPIDSRTRKWCMQHVGRVYTRTEIDELNNGQLSNVFLVGGGYNCRHHFMEVSQFSAAYKLVGTSKRLPEMMQEVRRVREAEAA